MIEQYFINSENSMLVIIDMQEKLIKVMEKEIIDKVIKNIIALIEVSKILNIPIILTEQYPKGLGPTIEEIKTVLPSYNPIEKITFSAFGEEKFIQVLKEKKREKILLTGIETHVCIWQTSLDFIMSNYTVFLPKDAVCSRKKLDWETGIDLIKSAGGIITTTETVIFQILKKAGTQEFKKIINFIK